MPMNPYQPPQQVEPAFETLVDESPPRFSIAISEIVAVVAVIGFMVGALIPAVDAERAVKGEELSYPAMSKFAEEHGWIYLAGCVLAPSLAVLGSLVYLRHVVPGCRKYLPWFSIKPPKKKKPRRTIPPWAESSR